MEYDKNPNAPIVPDLTIVIDDTLERLERAAQDHEYHGSSAVPSLSPHVAALELLRKLTLRKARPPALATPSRARSMDPDTSALVGNDACAGRVEAYSGTGDWPEPQSLEDAVPPFPVDALPESLADYVRAVATSTQTPVDLPAVLVLAAVSAAVAKKVELVIRPDWVEPLSTYWAAILRSGERKSAVMTMVTRPLREWEMAERARLAPEVAAAESRRVVLELQRSAAVRMLAKADGDAAAQRAELDRIEAELARLEAVFSPRLLADDITAERLGELLSQQGGRLALFSAEGGVLDQIGAHRSRGPNLDVYLKGYSGEPLQIDRKTGDSVAVARPALTVAVAVQPSVVKDVAKRPELRERGLLSRFFYSRPESRVGARETVVEPVPPGVAQVYGACIHRLLGSYEQRARGEVVASPLVLSDPARELLVEFSERVEPRLGEGGDLANMAAWGNKLVGGAARIAALLHLAKHGLYCPVAPEAVSGALSIADYLVPHAKAAFGLMRLDPTVEDARYIVGVARRKGIRAIEQHEFTEMVKGTVKGERFENAVRLLIERGYLRRGRDLAHTGPGPKPTLYRVNPRVHSQDSHNSETCE